MAMFCPECGTQNDDGAKFCKSCGRQLSDVADAQNVMAPPPGGIAADAQGRIIADDGSAIGRDLDGEPGGERLLWEGRPAFLTGPIAWLTIRYRVTNERIVQERGFISKGTEMVELYRTNDIRVDRGVLQRILGVGHVTVVSSDPSHPQFKFKDIGDPQRVSDLIRQAARAEEIRRRVYRREDV